MMKPSTRPFARLTSVAASVFDAMIGMHIGLFNAGNSRSRNSCGSNAIVLSSSGAAPTTCSGYVAALCSANASRIPGKRVGIPAPIST